MASTYLTKTFGTPTSDKIGTVSFWCKKAINDVNTNPYAAGGNTGALNFEAGNFIDVFEAGGWLRTTQLFRDLSAWYHIVRTVDTTQATASERLKLYVNGERVTSFTTANYPAQNASISFGGASQNVIGTNNSFSNYFNGCMAHFHNIDGTAYDPTAFGQFNANGIWTPNPSPSVTYGTNGFFLDMANPSDMGNDVSGNNNDFSVGAGTVTQALDTPSNVFATLNALNKGSAITLANGNLAWTQSASWNGVTGTIGVDTGKWYWEIKAGGVNAGGAIVVGVAGVNFDITSEPGSGTDSWRYRSDDGTIRNSTGSAYGDTWTSGDIIGIALDLGNSAMWFSKNGVWQNSATISEIENGTTTNAAFTNINELVVPVVGTYNSSSASYMNFGNGYFGTTAVASGNADSAGLGIFEYTVPSGYYSLCTKNIATYG